MLLIKQLLEEKNITHRELSTKIDLSPSSISRYSYDYSHIGLKDYETIINTLTDNKYNIDIEELVCKHIENIDKGIESEKSFKSQIDKLLEEVEMYKTDFETILEDLEKAQDEIKKLKEIIKNLSNII